MVASSLLLLFVILFVFSVLFIATMSFGDYFHVRSLLSAFPDYL